MKMEAKIASWKFHKLSEDFWSQNYRLKVHGVLTGCAGPYGNILKIRPPLTFYKKDADVFIDAIKASLKDVNL